MNSMTLKTWLRHVGLAAATLSLIVACQKKDDGKGEVKTPRGQEPAAPAKTEPSPQTPKLPPAPDKVGPTTKPGDQKRPQPGGGQDGDDGPADPTEDDDGPLTDGPEETNEDGPLVSRDVIPSTAGRDGVRDYLLSKVNAVTDLENQRRNQFNSDLVKRVHVSVDSQTNDVLVSITRGAQGKSEILQLGGMLDDRGATVLVPQGQTRQDVIGYLICLDANPKTCYVTRLKLAFGGAGNLGFVNVINRKSNANFSIKRPQSQAQSVAFSRLVDIFANNAQGKKSGDAVKTIIVETTEIIKSQSFVETSIVTRLNEALFVSGPLMMARDPEALIDVKLNTNPNIQNLLNLDTGKGFKTTINQSIKDARLVANDGDRRLSFLLATGSADASETLGVALTRHPVQLMDLEQLAQIDGQMDQAMRASMSQKK